MVFNETIFPRIAEITKETVCDIGLETILYYFAIPVLIGMLFIIILLFKTKISDFFESLYIKRGHVRIIYITTNKQVKIKFKKVDKYSTFKWKKSRYDLEVLKQFIIGYYKGAPVFLYDQNFILPLSIDDNTITKAIKEGYPDLPKEIIKMNEKISAIKMKINPNVLEMVYSRKLLSDLYSISRLDDALRNKIFYVIVGVIILLVLWYTGYLQKLLDGLL